MQLQARPQHKQLVRIAAIALATACTAVIAILLGWAPFSTGDASDNPAPGRLTALSVRAATPREAFADPAVESTDTPTEPTCAQLGGIASTEELERLGEPRGTVGCEMFGNLAADTPVSSQSDVEAFLAWHLEVRDLIRNAYQTGEWDMREQ
jgi:hypothetical protein